MKKMISVAIISVLILNLAAFGHCQDPVRKLGRGVANIITGPFEVPKNMIESYCKEKSLIDSFGYGVFKGLGMSLARIAVGVYETVTFPIPVPEGYMPTMEPEYLWEK